MHTKNCLCCLETATHWTGHIIKGKKSIRAGWCDKCLPLAVKMLSLAENLGFNLLGNKYCFGGYHRNYGVCLSKKIKNSLYHGEDRRKKTIHG